MIILVLNANKKGALGRDMLLNRIKGSACVFLGPNSRALKESKAVSWAVVGRLAGTHSEAAGCLVCLGRREENVETVPYMHTPPCHQATNVGVWKQHHSSALGPTQQKL